MMYLLSHVSPTRETEVPGSRHPTYICYLAPYKIFLGHIGGDWGRVGKLLYYLFDKY